MSLEENKALARRFFDAYNANDLDAAEAMLAENFLHNNLMLPPGVPPNRTAFKQLGLMFATAFPDHHSTIEDQVAEGNLVATRSTFRGTHQGELMGMPPTGKQVTFSSINIDRIENGKIVEKWEQSDLLGMMQQLGMIPSPEQVPA